MYKNNNKVLKSKQNLYFKKLYEDNAYMFLLYCLLCSYIALYVFICYLSFIVSPI